MIVRVGANVTLLRKLGFTRKNASTVYYWPVKKRKAGDPPIVFRMLEITGGKHPVFLLTDLRVSELSNSQLADLYRRRWEIEVHYRTFKCTFGRGKLRSYNAENAACELTWAVIGHWAAGQIAQSASGITPEKLSLVGMIRSLQLTITHYRVRPDEDEDLERNLRRSKLDDYNRESKSCRHPIIFPPNHKAKRKPKITDANAIQLRKIAKIKTEMRKLRLTA
jgi:hypothetical protein